MRLVLVESPFAGRSSGNGDDCAIADAAFNLAYVNALCLYIAKRSDAPFASHVFCTQFLDDTVPDERSMGIEIGLAWGAHASLTVVGVDRGISSGMRLGIERARAEGRPVEWVSLRAHRSLWLPHGVDRAAWIDLFREGDGQVRDD